MVSSWESAACGARATRRGASAHCGNEPQEEVNMKEGRGVGLAPSITRKRGFCHKTEASAIGRVMCVTCVRVSRREQARREECWLPWSVWRWSEAPAGEQGAEPVRTGKCARLAERCAKVRLRPREESSRAQHRRISASRAEQR